MSQVENTLKRNAQYGNEPTYANGYVLDGTNEVAPLGHSVVIEITIENTVERIRNTECSRLDGPLNADSWGAIKAGVDKVGWSANVKQLLHFGIFSYLMGKVTHSGSGPFNHKIEIADHPDVGEAFEQKSFVLLVDQAYLVATKNDPRAIRYLMGCIPTSAEFRIDRAKNEVSANFTGFANRMSMTSATPGASPLFWDRSYFSDINNGIIGYAATVQFRKLEDGEDPYVYKIEATMVKVKLESDTKGKRLGSVEINTILVGRLSIKMEMEFYNKASDFADHLIFNEILENNFLADDKSWDCQISLITAGGLVNISIDRLVPDGSTSGPTMSEAGAGMYSKKFTCGNLTIDETNAYNQTKNGKLVMYSE